MKTIVFSDEEIETLLLCIEFCNDEEHGLTLEDDYPEAVALKERLTDLLEGKSNNEIRSH